MPDNYITKEEFNITKKEFSERFDSIELSIKEMKETYDNRFESVERRLLSMEKMFERFESKLDKCIESLPVIGFNRESIVRLEDKTDDISNRTSNMEGVNQSNHESIVKLEDKTDDISNRKSNIEGGNRIKDKLVYLLIGSIFTLLVFLDKSFMA